MDHVDVLGLRLQERGGGRQEVDVRVAADPATTVERYRLPRAGCPGGPFARSPSTVTAQRRHGHAAHDLDGRPAGGDVDAELARHVGVLGTAQDDVGPEVLGDGGVDLEAVPDGREDPAVRAP